MSFLDLSEDCLNAWHDECEGDECDCDCHEEWDDSALPWPAGTIIVDAGGLT